MILAIDTSSATCSIWFVNGDVVTNESWEADRQLGDELIGHLRRLLKNNGKNWQDISGIAVFQGPGSFTGLRIGLTVMNTIADTNVIPIIGEQGEDWMTLAIDRLRGGQNDELVMPLYGREANITKPRK